METSYVERRMQRIAAHDVVQAGIVLQAQAGTISAIEFLKSHDVAGAVIARVMSGGRLRAQDRAVAG